MSTTLSFRQGVSGYVGTVDTNLRADKPTNSYAATTQLFADSDSPNGAGTPAQALLRFDGLFGTSAGQIPLGARIVSATLTLETTDVGDGAALHRMLRSWSATDTWSSLGNGLQADGVEALATADLVTGRMGTTGSRSFDVTTSVAAWAGGAANNGWAVLPLGTDGWGFQSAEGTSRPQLTIVYETGSTTPPSSPVLSLSGPLSQAEGNSGTTAFTFTVTRSGDTGVAASAAWAVTGSGTNPASAADFAGATLPSGTISFAAGETSRIITVNVAGDTAVEPNETFTLSLSNPSAGTTLGTASTTGTITNDDAATPPAGQVTLSFRQGVSGYVGTVDTNLRADKPTNSYAATTQLFADSDSPNGAGTPAQALLRFDGLFGTSAGQIPLGARIVSATLTLETTDVGDGAALHRMLRSWSATDTWSSLGNGLQADGVEALATADLVTGRMGTTGSRSFDVTTSVAAWAGGAANNGWAVLPLGTDGWGFQSAEGTSRPQLTIVYETGSTTPPSSPVLSLSGPLSQAEGNSGTTAFTFTVTRSGDTGVAASAAWAVTGSGTNPASAADFAGATLPSGTISFAAGETSRIITVNVAGDTAVEPNETFTLSLSNPSAGTTLGTASTTGTITNDDAATARPFDESYVATTYTGRMRALEHGNASKSLFVDGDWYAVLPDGPKWFVERFSGDVPAAGQKGGWTRASTDRFLDGNRASDIAWDDATNSLYVLQYWESSAKPMMFKLNYDAGSRSFVHVAEAQIAGSGGKLAASHWSSNPEMVIGLDPFGTPLVADIGKATTGPNRGLHLSWSSKDLVTWGETTIDAEPTGAGKNAKADIVSFTQNGVPRIGIAYSSDRGGIDGDGSKGSWKFAWRDASSNPADYATGWQVETFNATVHVDNHTSAVFDGTNIYIAMKDDQNSVWLTKGMPGRWETALVVDSARTPGDGPSRPTLAVDEADNRLLVVYQRSTGGPFDGIFMKSVDLDGALSFDPTSLGTRIMTTTNGTGLVDPQLPVHAIDASMDGMFPLLAANAAVREVWYNPVELGAWQLIA